VNTDNLRALGQNAHAWAKTYVTLKECLLREGVQEDEAREEARHAATMAALMVEDGEACPLCGRGE
jgi:hypothetical protein